MRAAGSIGAGEDIEAAVQRELQEEIGARAEKLRSLGGFYVARKASPASYSIRTASPELMPGGASGACR